MTDESFDEHRPLDALLPGLSESAPLEDRETGPPMNPSVLEVELERGYEWLYAGWSDPGGGIVLRTELERLMAVTLLWHLSTPADDVDPRHFRFMRLLLFDDIAGNPGEALSTLGFEISPYDPDSYRGRLLSLHELAEQAGWEIPNRPRSIWEAEILEPEAPLVGRMRDVEEALVQKLQGDFWGSEPGRPSKLLSEQLRIQFGTELEPNSKGLETLDVLLLDHTPQRIRWMTPMIFQAICDFIGVVIQNEYQRQVGWAESKIEPETGQPQPPLLRVSKPEGAELLSIGLRVVQWYGLPQMPGLAERLLDKRVAAAVRDL